MKQINPIDYCDEDIKFIEHLKRESKKLIYGVGVCDVTTRENGKQKKSYHAWCNMLRRCYDPKYHTRHQTYVGCSVSVEWHKYSVFEKFFAKHYRGGYSLDKDLLVRNNKVYGPTTCCFVPAHINTLLVKCDSSRGKYAIGVAWSKRYKKFEARCRADGKFKFVGYFDTELEAHESYCRFKEAHIAQVAALAFYNKEIDLTLLKALLRYEVSVND